MMPGLGFRRSNGRVVPDLEAAPPAPARRARAESGDARPLRKKRRALLSIRPATSGNGDRGAGGVPRGNKGAGNARRIPRRGGNAGRVEDRDDPEEDAARDGDDSGGDQGKSNDDAGTGDANADAGGDGDNDGGNKSSSDGSSGSDSEASEDSNTSATSITTQVEGVVKEHLHRAYAQCDVALESYRADRRRHLAERARLHGEQQRLTEQQAAGGGGVDLATLRELSDTEAGAA
eukprot:TRINITY_DN3950_c1_g1_i1.p1 TRINITY_DN3950_c1_g1~~TRINITY_DN3950_c1_g1_i1.p1  ORF type:complete len:234 (-),score=58.91 TRINITY_DN3950_c1_g1_i1:1171-1872(-)